MLVAFFLPWGQFMGASASAYDATKLGSYANLLWLVPLFAAATLGNEYFRGPLTVFPVLTSIFALYILAFAADRAPVNALHVFSIGAYVNLLASVALLTHELGFIPKFGFAPPSTNKKLRSSAEGAASPPAPSPQSSGAGSMHSPSAPPDRVSNVSASEKNTLLDALDSEALAKTHTKVREVLSYISADYFKSLKDVELNHFLVKTQLTELFEHETYFRFEISSDVLRFEFRHYCGFLEEDTARDEMLAILKENNQSLGTTSCYACVQVINGTPYISLQSNHSYLMKWPSTEIADMINLQFHDLKMSVFFLFKTDPPIAPAIKVFGPSNPRTPRE